MYVNDIRHNNYDLVVFLTTAVPDWVDYFRVHRSSPLLLSGLALRPLPPSLLPGSHPPPPLSALAGFSFLSSL